MRCGELMKRDIECVKADDTIQSAARKMRDRDVGFLPVCDDGWKVLGTITDRDIAIRAAAENRAADATPVTDVMTREVVACRPGDDLKKAEELMASRRKSRIMVLDDKDVLVGMISLSDVALHDQKNAARTVHAVSEREARGAR